MLSDHLILCGPLLLLPSIFPSIGVFSNESALCIRWPKYWSFSNSSFNEYSGSISFQIDWFDLLAVHASLTLLVWGALLLSNGKPKKASQTPRVGRDGGPAFSFTVVVSLCTGQENSQSSHFFIWNNNSSLLKYRNEVTKPVETKLLWDRVFMKQCCHEKQMTGTLD